jgi:3-methyladenine DNA glycosylase AlkD
MATAPTAASILAELPKLGTASYKKVIMTHGVREPVHGVKISDLKLIQKRAGGTNHALAQELWDSGVYDAMYLAGLLVDDAQMTKRDLQRWIDGAYCGMLSEYSVAWVTAGSPDGWRVARKWIDSKKEREAAAGWNALAGIAAMTADDDLDLDALRELLQRIPRTIGTAANRAKYAMNGFVAAIGIYVKPLAADALAVGKALGTVEVDMGGTSCKVPSVPEMIAKAKARGAIGKKRKMVKC